MGFGATVRRLRMAQGVGVRALAARVGMSPTYLSRVELGQLDPPTEEKVRAIARELGHDQTELLALAGRVGAEPVAGTGCTACHRRAVVRLTGWGEHDIDLCLACVRRVYEWLRDECMEPVF